MSSYSRQQLEEWVSNIDAGGNVLDIGGCQYPIKGRTKSWNVKNYRILDLPDPHEDRVGDSEYIITADINTCGRISGSYKYREEFTQVFCLEVMEYVWHPINALRNMNRFLKIGGELYISFHFIYPVHNPTNQDYFRYTNRGAFKLLEKTGFKVVEERERYAHDSTALMRFFRNEKMRPAKKYLSHDSTGILIKAQKICETTNEY